MYLMIFSSYIKGFYWVKIETIQTKFCDKGYKILNDIELTAFDYALIEEIFKAIDYVNLKILNIIISDYGNH